MEKLAHGGMATIQCFLIRHDWVIHVIFLRIHINRFEGAISSCFNPVVFVSLTAQFRGQTCRRLAIHLTGRHRKLKGITSSSVPEQETCSIGVAEQLDANVQVLQATYAKDSTSLMVLNTLVDYVFSHNILLRKH